MSHFWAWLVGAASLLAGLAVFSRIATLPQAPEYIKTGSDALTKLFNGAFGY